MAASKKSIAPKSRHVSPLRLNSKGGGAAVRPCMSGTPTNDRFQVVENQMCGHRLFSIHPDYRRDVWRWLAEIKAGVRAFDDYCQLNLDSSR